MPRKTQDEACRAIVDRYADRGWGWRYFAIGASGAGKTYFAKRLIAYAMARGEARFAFVCDYKDPEPSFKGLVRADVASFATSPPAAGDPRVFVFHAPDAAGRPSEIAQKGYDVRNSIVVIDELYPDAVKDGNRWADGDDSAIPTILRLGRSRNVSLVLGTQVPQGMPGSVALCDARAFFRCTSESLDYIATNKRAPREAIEVIRSLKEGEFILLVEGEWTGCIYGPK